jgi:hypothetical protein
MTWIMTSPPSAIVEIAQVLSAKPTSARSPRLRAESTIR